MLDIPKRKNTQEHIKTRVILQTTSSKDELNIIPIGDATITNFIGFGLTGDNLV